MVRSRSYLASKKGHQDVVQPPPSTHKKTNAGPIAGGVIGGIAVILIGGGIAFFLYRKTQKQREKPVKLTHIDDDGRGHARTTSDLSQKSNGKSNGVGIGYGYNQMDRSFITSPSSQAPLSPTSGTMLTHDAMSVNSLSYFGSVNHSVAPYGPTSPSPAATRPLSPFFTSPPSHIGMNREDIIVPFTLPPSSEGVSHQSSHVNLADRKRADGAIVPIYDSPNSLPSHVGPTAGSSIGDSPARTRVNPPAYSAVDGVSIAPARQMHSKKGSGDTTYTIDSMTSGGVTSVAHANHQHQPSGGSISAIDDVIGQMGFGQGQESVSGSGSGGTLLTGQSRQFVKPFRPVLGNPDP
ncbi:hypothetical protein C0991_009507 [Blastosporella zonata]|nr:hypothetical protein C0991_009507 [Blastosporella zonata]